MSACVCGIIAEELGYRVHTGVTAERISFKGILGSGEKVHFSWLLLPTSETQGARGREVELERYYVPGYIDDNGEATESTSRAQSSPQFVLLSRNLSSIV